VENSLSDLLVAARAIHFASTAMLAGLFLFMRCVGEPVLRARSNEAITTLRSRFLVVGWSSLAVSLSSGAAWLVLLAFNLGGQSWTTLIAENTPWTVLTETRFGNDWFIRLGLAALLGICLLRFDQRRGWRSHWQGSPSALLSACLMATLAWAGHGGGTGNLAGLQVAADALHLIAAAAWIGGLPALVMLLAFAYRTNPPSLALAAEATSRFSRLGLVSVCTLLATGIVNSAFLVGSVPGLVGTSYGRLLLAKIALFAAMASIAVINRLHLLPGLSRSADAIAALRQLQRNALIEIGLGLVVLMIVGALGTMPPAAHVQASWPFPMRLSLDALQDPTQRLELAGVIAAAVIGIIAILVGSYAKRWRWLLLATGTVLLVWIGPRLNLFTEQAYPTSFYISPTGYSAQSIAAGRKLFAENCVSCHGPLGHGDGPAAKDLRPPPADLTAEHIYGHSDGDLFWWISQGLGEAMPGFGAVLDETARWNLIDFIHANADARRLELADDAGVAIRVPEFSVECPDGSDLSIGQLRGRIVHVVFASPHSAARLDQLAALRTEGQTSIAVRIGGLESPSFCSTSNPDVIAAFAIYRGTGAIDGTEFLIDALGWLRSMWYSGLQPDWRDPAILT